MRMLKYLIPIAALTGLILTSCNEKPVEPTAPSASVKVDELSRTEVKFTISSSDAQDYAFIIAEKGTQVTSAEELFETGENGMLENGTATITSSDIEGAKEYTLFVAVRKINPYVYSEVYSAELNTDIPYTELLTMSNIGYTDYSYHVEVPAGATAKHISIKSIDYEAIKAIIGDYGDVTYSMYLETFGHEITESSDITIDSCSLTALDDNIFVYSGTDYIVMAGIVGTDGVIADENLSVIEFSTREAEECPLDITITVEPFSNRAVATITPDNGLISYRVKIDTRMEFEYVGGEGLNHLKSFVIGPWYDKSNEYTEAATVEASGLRPNTDYVVGVVGFDAEHGEVFKSFDFRTTEPVGPEPTIELTQVTPTIDAPWTNAAVNTKVQYTIEIRGGFFPKKSLDDVVASGYSLIDVVWNNGLLFTPEELAAALSEEGNVTEVEGLDPETEYVFGVAAMNDEYVTACDTLAFKTAEVPQLGGEVRKQMPGNYIASTTDEDGNTVTFPVIITKGVNETTEVEYAKKNRLVCLGFGPESEFPYISPEDLGGQNAYQDYGPKWFIEFTEDEIITPSACFPNDTVFKWNMGLVDGKSSYMWGYGVRPSTGLDTDANSIGFKTEVSPDGNIITIKGTMGEFGGVTYYPTMVLATDLWWTDEILFRCYSDLILTRQPE